MSRFSMKKIRLMRRSGNPDKTPKGAGRGTYIYSEAMLDEVVHCVSHGATEGKGRAKFRKLCRYYRMSKGKYQDASMIITQKNIYTSTSPLGASQAY